MTIENVGTPNRETLSFIAAAQVRVFSLKSALFMKNG